jgi:hypothetical protein
MGSLDSQGQQNYRAGDMKQGKIEFPPKPQPEHIELPNRIPNRVSAHPAEILHALQSQNYNARHRRPQAELPTAKGVQLRQSRKARITPLWLQDLVWRLGEERRR